MYLVFSFSSSDHSVMYGLDYGSCVTCFCGMTSMLYVMSCILLLPESSLDAPQVKFALWVLVVSFRVVRGFYILVFLTSLPCTYLKLKLVKLICAPGWNLLCAVCVFSCSCRANLGPS